MTEYFSQQEFPLEPIEGDAATSLGQQAVESTQAPSSTEESLEQVAQPLGVVESRWYRGSAAAGRALGSLALRSGHETAADVLRFTGEVVGVAPTFVAMHASRIYHSMIYNLTHPRPKGPTEE